MKKPIQVSGPASLLAALPFMLGFKPQNSLVCVLLTQDAITGCVRYELEADSAELFELIENTIKNHEFDSLVVVAIADSLTTDLTALLNQFRSAEIALLDFLITNWIVYKSVICNDSNCCPLEGNELRLTEQDAMAAELIASGHVAANSRAELLARLAPAEPSEKMIAAISAVETQLEGVELMTLLTTLHRKGLSETQIAQLALALANSDLRNVVEYELFDSKLGELTNPAQLRIATENILQCAVSVPAEFAAMPYGLLAFCYWNLGDWILATSAANYALKLDPINSPAKLVKNLIQQGVDPVAARREIFPSAA
jgi:hypothetical protein